MTITFYNDLTKEHYGAFTAAGKDGQFSYKQKMQIATLRVKLLSKLGIDAHNVIVHVVMDRDERVSRLLA